MAPGSRSRRKRNVRPDPRQRLPSWSRRLRCLPSDRLGAGLQPLDLRFQFLDALRELVDGRSDFGLAVARHDVLSAVDVPGLESEGDGTLGPRLVDRIDKALHQLAIAFDYAGATPPLDPLF